ncbi:hypothetical protein [Sphingosinicella rhizophila]|uniref:DUF2285 domain-containing protein n=1 Tax=Sphingosinicella rhizophila TaxID=3050082 RepID=A0ABU3Q5C8_9SPHN|nr:hypothetical protein [Sphingosinicella sp. GR2756]MDT9598614.1 hypothetical protein [Sphingosinicella sp. GR2756]
MSCRELTPFDRLDRVAPKGGLVLDYDRRHLLIYAELLYAEAAGLDWQSGALDILGIDPLVDPDHARSCWDSHLARARWITSEGLDDAIEAFGNLPLHVGSNSLK